MNDFYGNFELPNIELPDIYTPVAYSYSDTQYEIIKKYIQDFEQTLDAEHEVALYLTHMGHSVLMRVTNITYENSVVLVFKGYIDNKMSTLIQHVSQLNFLITSVDKEPERPKRPIGFTCPD